MNTLSSHEGSFTSVFDRVRERIVNTAVVITAAQITRGKIP